MKNLAQFLMMKKTPLLIFAILVFVTGCHVGPSYRPPTPEVPEKWKGSHEAVATGPCVDQWWEVFDDAVLNALEMQVLDSNPDLYVALQRIFEAKAMAGVSEADLYPQVSLDPTYSNTGTLFKLFGIPQNVIDVFGIKPIIRIHQMMYTFPMNMSYEFDLWGRLYGLFKSAYLNVQAQEEAYYTTMLTLTSDLASNYFNMRTLEAQAELLQKTIAIRQKNYDLTQLRFQKGIVTYLDVAEASLDLASSQAEYDDTIRQRNLMENAIALLIGIPASDLRLDYQSLVGSPPLIPAGIPASVIAQRPDIAEAERTMASEHALIGVAYASFLPSFSLTGALGFASPDFDLFMKWKSRYWNISANIGQTLFDGGRKYSNLQVSWARYQEAAGNYQKVTLQAFKEVEDALNDIEWQAKRAENLQKAVDAASKATELSRKRYIRGVTNYLEVVVNERSELDVRRQHINVLGQRFQSTIQLIKALGGSWIVDSEEEVDCPDDQAYQSPFSS